jgi:beta-phosphoglucomutase-like phosphatase (HAD superfamily)
MDVFAGAIFDRDGVLLDSSSHHDVLAAVL